VNPHFSDKVFLLSVQALQKGTHKAPVPAPSQKEVRDVTCNAPLTFRCHSISLLVFSRPGIVAKSREGFRALHSLPCSAVSLSFYFDRAQLLAVRFVALGALAGGAFACVCVLALFFCTIF
jgi:hypothetical protein